MSGQEEAARQHAALYAPSVAELCKYLPDAGDSTAAALAELCRDPSRDGCERMQVKLHGLQRQVRELHLAIQREQ